MRDDFCAFILTHGRPDKVLTYRTLRRAGYTGKIFIVVDDEDKTRHQYMAEFGEQVLVFSKADIASRFDEADNFCDRRSIFYARNACFDLAKLVGCKYFIQLDDDYHEFQFRVDRNYDQAYFPIRKLDAILSEMLAYYESIPALSIAMSQGGDFLGDNGGHASWVKRKAMNSFICSVDRPFSFMGRINEDVNTYTNLGRCGELFMTIGAVQLGQKQTQKNSGGMTELYLDSGTDLSVKSVTTSSPVKSGGGGVEILGSVADFSAMSCYVRGLNSTGSSAAWVLGMHSGESKMVSLKNYHSNAEILLNGSDGAVQLKTGNVNGAAAQALTINKDEVNSTVDLTLTKQSGTGNRFILQNLGNTELSFAAKVWGSSDRQNVFEVGTSAAYLFYAQKTSAGQLFDVNGAINCTTLNQSSDRDLKDDILVISDATKAIRKMNGYTYTLRENGMPYAGVIAQEVMEAIPEAVGSFTHYGEELQGPTVDGNELREETRYLNVDYSAVTGLLVQVARETDDRVTALEEENTTLRENLATADTRITTLENQVSELVALVRQLTGSEH
ncbi:tail fiber domain-containing protein [Escherichia coli]|nr:tail fiber domain-containing protein [Escherichia coli]